MKYLAALSVLLLTSIAFPQTQLSEDAEVLASIEFIESENELELGFETALYLPEDFDPYAQVHALHAFHFLPMEEEAVEIGEETLPVNFDPHGAR